MGLPYVSLYGLCRLYKAYRPMSEKPAARAMVLPSKSCCGCRFSIGKPHLWLVVVGGGGGGGWLVGGWLVVAGWLVVLGLSQGFFLDSGPDRRVYTMPATFGAACY